MKKVMVIVLCLFLLIGCVDYNTYDVKNKPVDISEDLSKLEKELEASSNSTAVKEVVEELPVAPISNKSMAVTGVVTVTIKENELLKLKVQGNDPDKDPVKYTFSKPLNASGEWKTNYGDAGEYLTSIMASDGKLSSERKVKIMVERVNVAPIIENVKDLVVTEGETVKFEPKVKDPNKDSIKVTINEPLKSGTFVTDHTSSGTYTIKVVASDGELEASKSFKLIVNDVNVLPVITNLAKEIKVKEGEQVKIEPKVTDLDKEDNVTLSISDPVGNDGLWQTSYTDHGEYTITIVASDGKGKTTEKVKVLVEDVNMPPQIVDVSLAP